VSSCFLNAGEEGWLWSALFYMFLCSLQQCFLLYFFAWFVMCWFCFFSFLSLTHISTHLCIASPPSLFSTSDRVRSPSDRSQAAPEQQRLDDAIGFLRDHAEVIARVAFYLFIFKNRIFNMFCRLRQHAEDESLQGYSAM
jgi:hypothetical protein